MVIALQPVAGFADESSKNAREFGNAVEADADWLGSGGDPSKMAYAELGRGSAVARLKDIATIQGVRENQLVGYGLVIGLKGSGDSLRNSPLPSNPCVPCLIILASVHRAIRPAQEYSSCYRDGQSSRFCRNRFAY